MLPRRSVSPSPTPSPALDAGAVSAANSVTKPRVPPSGMDRLDFEISLSSQARARRFLRHGDWICPSVAYYPFHGIFISLDLTNIVELGLHVPAGTTVELNGSTVHMTGIADSGPIDTTIPIRAARHDYVRKNDPLAFSARDTFTAADNFGPLLGDTSNGRDLWYSFISETSEPVPHYIRTPNGLIRGTVELPPITINGQSYEAQSIRFERRVHTEVSPVNC